MHTKAFTTEGIILKRINYKEADKIVTVYTTDLGKITALAKGVRKLSSKKRSDLELFNKTKLHITEGYAFHLVTQTEIIDSFPNIKDDTEKANITFFIAEIFEKMTPEEDENKTLYNFLSKTLEIINREQVTITLINAFMIKLLRLNGFYSDSDKQIRFNIEESKYLKSLINTKLNLINNCQTDSKIESKINKYLISYTEEILNLNLKTKPFINQK